MTERASDKNLVGISETIFTSILKSYDAPEISLRAFVDKAWTILNPGNPLIPGWHVDLICEYLELVTDGKILRLLINIPPRNAKSNLVTICWPVWSWIRRASLRFVFCSYSASLSTKHSLDRRRIIESDWFRENWGGVVQMKDDQNQKNEYENTARGHMISTSVGGTITGKGGDVIVEDDMLNPLDAASMAARKHSLDMHKYVLANRLDDPKTGAKVIVEQRTDVNDVSGYVLKEEGGYVHISLPLMFEHDQEIVFPKSGRIVNVKAGDFLNPDRQGQAEHDSIKKTMGSRAFNAQFQQKPTTEAGNILKRGWWKYWAGDVKLLQLEGTLQSWDLSFLKTETGSFVVGQVWGKRGNRLYLLDQIRERMDFTDSLAAIVNLTARWPLAHLKLIEDKANGPAVMNVLKNKLMGIVAVTPLGSKLARAQAASPVIEAGNVYLPDPIANPWVSDFIEECAAFQGIPGETNDQVDAMSQAIVRLCEVDTSMPDSDEGEEFIENDVYNLETAGGFTG